MSFRFGFFPGTDLSKKHIRKSSSNSKITSTNENQGGCGGTGTTLGGSSSSGGKVRTIEIKRETDTPLHRSNSGSSDTSSGFGSLNNSDQQATSSAGKLTIFSRLKSPKTAIILKKN